MSIKGEEYNSWAIGRLYTKHHGHEMLLPVPLRVNRKQKPSVTPKILNNSQQTPREEAPLLAEYTTYTILEEDNVLLINIILFQGISANFLPSISYVYLILQTFTTGELYDVKKYDIK